jgi:hypothetical protein
MINTYTTYLCVISTGLPAPVENVYTIQSSPALKSKGPTTFTFNLSNISEYPFKINRLKINFDDRDYTPTIISTTRDVTLSSSDILTQYSNTFYPSIRSYYTQFNVVFTFYRENGDIIVYTQPITVAQASIYDDVDNLYIKDSQAIDKRINHNLLNLVSHKTQYTIVGVLST